MGSSTSGYIIVKDGDKGRRMSYREFYGPLDKGAAKPSFCYPKRKEDLVEEIKKIKHNIDMGYVKDKLMEMKMKLKTRQERLDKLNEQESAATKLFNENKDQWLKRRETLAEDIRAATPSLDAVSKRRTNPFKVLANEKNGLEDKKREYIVLSRLAGEESNITFLQKEKDSD